MIDIRKDKVDGSKFQKFLAMAKHLLQIIQWQD